MLVFGVRRKPKWGEKPLRTVLRIHKLNLHRTSRPGIEGVTPWQKAIAPTTATVLLLLIFSLLLSVNTELVLVPDSK